MCVMLMPIMVSMVAVNIIFVPKLIAVRLLGKLSMGCAEMTLFKVESTIISLSWI